MFPFAVHFEVPLTTTGPGAVPQWTEDRMWKVGLGDVSVSLLHAGE
jgi:hypothetical protein